MNRALGGPLMMGNLLIGNLPPGRHQAVPTAQEHRRMERPIINPEATLQVDLNCFTPDHPSLKSPRIENSCEPRFS